jgi:two-component system, response regulator PdtaR
MNRLRIAVADDDQEMREYLREALQRLGHEVVAVVGTGRELADSCRAAAPDLALADVRMPDMDGIEAAAVVNRERPVPFVLVSAHDTDELMGRAGVDHIMGYLVKPVKEADLKAAISVAMLRFQQFLTLAREAADLRQALEDRKLVERAKGAVMRRVRVDEEEAFRRLRKLSSTTNRKLTEVARDVLAAEDVFHRLDAL